MMWERLFSRDDHCHNQTSSRLACDELSRVESRSNKKNPARKYTGASTMLA
jgi:hypothetical protein